MDEAQLQHRRHTVRQALIEARGQIERVREDRDTWIIEAAELGIPKTEIADLAGVSRDTVYDVLKRKKN